MISFQLSMTEINSSSFTEGRARNSGVHFGVLCERFKALSKDFMCSNRFLRHIYDSMDDYINPKINSNYESRK